MLKIEDLKVSYKSMEGDIEVLQGLDLEIQKGECLGLAGESGCGKTTVGLSITRLIPAHIIASISGRILFHGMDILSMDIEEVRRVRGKKISYVFQDPFTSLNPVLTIYRQIEECLKDHTDREARIAELLEGVGLSKIVGNKKVYPHELSGGMQQRVMIAMAIASNPELLILDEPTTALDVTSQNQILNLILELKNKMGLTILFITHNLKTIFRVSERIAIMYAGRIVEIAETDELKSKPAHPYTIGLIDSLPSLAHRKKRFNAIEGKAPSFLDMPVGCKFYPRCRFKLDRCRDVEPRLNWFSDNHASRCFRVEELIGHGIDKGP